MMLMPLLAACASDSGDDSDVTELAACQCMAAADCDEGKVCSVLGNGPVGNCFDAPPTGRCWTDADCGGEAGSCEDASPCPCTAPCAEHKLGTCTNIVVNGCGTFDLNEPGHGIVPDDPDMPEIVAACEAYCAKAAAVAGCGTTEADCTAGCKAESCDVCPGTWSPLVECMSDEFTDDACACNETSKVCTDAVAACKEKSDATGQCGG